MPELPEVEEVRRTLIPVLVGARIMDIKILRPDYIRSGLDALPRLCGHKVVAIDRHGKWLFCRLDHDQTLVLHLGMSGRISAAPVAGGVEKHTHLVFTLDSQRQVRVCDPRRFGGVWLHETMEQARAAHIHKGVGVDALLLEFADLQHWRRAGGRLKTTLLSQRDVAGLGNIYIDEALWLARLHPQQILNRLSDRQIQTLVECIGAVLAQSLRLGGTTLRDYRNVALQEGRFAKKLQVYGRGGLPCKRCGAGLKAIAISGRTTVFCPACQKRITVADGRDKDAAANPRRTGKRARNANSG